MATLRQILCALRPSGHDWQMDVEPHPEAPAIFVRCLACGQTSKGVQWDVRRREEFSARRGKWGYPQADLPHRNFGLSQR